MGWMPCTTCKRIVKINNTGICIGCQRGFTGTDEEDAWKPEPIEEIQEEKHLKSKEKENQNAFEEVSKQESNLREYKDGDGDWETPKASNRYSSKRRKESKEQK